MSSNRPHLAPTAALARSMQALASSMFPSASLARPSRTRACGSSRWAATLRAALSPNGSHGVTPSAVNPADGEASHCMGVRAASRPPAPTPGVNRSLRSSLGTATSVIAISSP